MNEILIRFVIVKNGKIIEASLDERLSFRNNLRHLGELAGEDLSQASVYDPYKKIFLDRNIVLAKFNISRFITLHLFT